jgi:AraC-like DNA-binding protein
MPESDPLRTALGESAAEFAHGITSRFGVSVDCSSRRPERRVLGGAAPFGRVDETGIGELRFFDIDAASHCIEREQRHIGPGCDDTFKLSVQLSGTALLIQDGREAVVRPGDIAIYDTRRPYSIECGEDFRTLIMLFPKHMISVPQETMGQVTAVPINRDSGPSELALPFLQRIGRDLGRLTQTGGRRLAHMALDFVSMVYWQELRDAEIGTNSHELLYTRLVAYIDDHLGDPELSAERIAAAHYVSPRLLRAVFQEHDDGVAARIRRRRIERCRDDLADPLYAHLPIRGIAGRWAFTDPPHFSRLFRAQLGVSPAEWRRRSLADAAPSPLHTAALWEW